MTDVNPIIDRLVNEGLVPKGSLKGGTETDIEAVIADQQVTRLPSPYVCYLKRIGRGAGPLLQGTDAFFPNILGLKQATIDLLAESGSGIELGPDAFVIAMHQRYQAFWFTTVMDDDPKVLMFQEGDKSVCREWANFATYLDDMTKGIDQR